MMDYLLPVEIELLPVSERITMERQMARKGCERERSRDANPEWPMYFFSLGHFRVHQVIHL